MTERNTTETTERTLTRRRLVTLSGTAAALGLAGLAAGKTAVARVAVAAVEAKTEAVEMTMAVAVEGAETMVATTEEAVEVEATMVEMAEAVEMTVVEAEARVAKTTVEATTARRR